MQELAPAGPCYPDFGCPELHPNAQAQVMLLQDAFGQLHSAGFYQAVPDTGSELDSMTRGCGALFTGESMAIVFCVVAWMVLLAVVLLSFQEQRERIVPLAIGAVLTAAFAVTQMRAATMPDLATGMRFIQASASVALGAASALFTRLVIQQLRSRRSKTAP